MDSIYEFTLDQYPEFVPLGFNDGTTKAPLELQGATFFVSLYNPQNETNRKGTGTFKPIETVDPDTGQSRIIVQYHWSDEDKAQSGVYFLYFGCERDGRKRTFPPLIVTMPGR